MSTFTPLAAIGLLAVIDVTAALGQITPAPAPALPQNSPSVATTAAPLPPGYIIGPDDILQIVFWRDKDLSSEVVVRPDGRISLPLINDVMAAGRTPEELRADLDRKREQVSRQSQRDCRRQGNSEPQGLHHRQRREAGPVRPDLSDDRRATHRHGRRPEGIRRPEEHRHHANGQRAAHQLQR